MFTTKNRLTLHEKLVDILGCDNVYFQAPASFRMQYPCIRYKLERENVMHANNHRYIGKAQYSVTVIDPNPDSEIPSRVAELPLCTLDRVYPADNLNHFVYTLYY